MSALDNAIVSSHQWFSDTKYTEEEVADIVAQACEEIDAELDVKNAGEYERINRIRQRIQSKIVEAINA